MPSLEPSPLPEPDHAACHQPRRPLLGHRCRRRGGRHSRARVPGRPGALPRAAAASDPLPVGRASMATRSAACRLRRPRDTGGVGHPRRLRRRPAAGGHRLGAPQGPPQAPGGLLRRYRAPRHRRRQGLTAIHGPVVKAAGQLLDGDAQARALVRRQLEETLALIGGTCEQRLPITGWGDAPARLTGTVVGGNLITLASLAGTPAAFRAPPGALVVLEDVGEPYYRLERALWQLVHGGALDAAAAVCLGTFEGCSAFDETPLEAIVTETLAPLGVPLYHGLPVGHGLHNRPWRVGAPGLIEGGELIMAG